MAPADTRMRRAHYPLPCIAAQLLRPHNYPCAGVPAPPLRGDLMKTILLVGSLLALLLGLLALLTLDIVKLTS